MIGEKHGLALDANFFARNLPTYGLAPKFGSTPYDSPLVDYESREQAARVLTGDELLVVAWPAPEDDVSSRCRGPRALYKSHERT